MLKSSLLEIIRTFSKQEMIKFEDFVRSPYFNKKEVVLNLFLIINKYAPELTDKNLEKERVWTALFPDKAYNYGIMKNLIFDLNKLLERFIFDLQSEEGNPEPKLLLFLYKKNLRNLFLKKFDSLSRTYDHDYFLTLNSFSDEYYDFWYEVLDLKYQVSHYSVYEPTDHNDICLQLTVSFLIKSFRMYQNIIANNIGGNINIENNPTILLLKLIGPKSFDKILENIKKISEIDYLHLKIYYNMYCMFTDKSGKSYFNFKNLLFDNLNIFSFTDLRGLHFFLISGIDQEINPKINVALEKLSVFDSMISLNILTEINGIIPEHIFVYYVTLSYQENDIVRLNKFADKFIDKLDKDIRSNLNNYVKALNYSSEGKYEDSLKAISLIDPNYFVMKLYLRFHKGLCLYKINDYEMFLNDYDSVKHFVKNYNKLNKGLKTKLEKYYYFLSHLFKLRENFSEYDLQKLIDETNEYYKSDIKIFRNESNFFSSEINELQKQYSKKVRS